MLIAGGERALTGAPSAEIIRTATGRSLPLRRPCSGPHVRGRHAVMDGKVLISGGTGLAARDTVEIYDPMTGEFTLLPGRLAVGRYAHTMCASTLGAS